MPSTASLGISAPLPSRENVSPPPMPALSFDALVSLNIMKTGEILPLVGRSEATLGRVSQGQPIIPDIDLTPYHAYEEGVSRLHASIKITESQVIVLDLGSANGTRLNGKKIPPHVPQILSHGDVLTLGKFKIQILIRS